MPPPLRFGRNAKRFAFLPLRHSSLIHNDYSLYFQNTLPYPLMNPLQQRVSWAAIHRRDIRNHLILLDIDGVLMADGETTIAPEMREHVVRLTKHNDVRILTNTFFKKRAQYVRDTLHIPWIDSPYKKPSIKILIHCSRNPTPRSNDWRQVPD